MPTTDGKENAGRLRSFKNNAKDNSEMRRRRADVSVELRRARKDEQMLKRRNVAVELEDTTPLVEANQGPLETNIPLIIEKMYSSDPQMQLNGVQAMRYESMALIV
jgi:importin subunit alpha-2